MIRNSIRYVLVILACCMPAVVPALAAQPGSHLPAWFTQVGGSNSPRMQAARQEALASQSGKIATATAPRFANEGRSSKHTLYVGCTNTPLGSTFTGPTGISDALAVVVPNTTIKVCAGTYFGGNLLLTPRVAIVGQGPSGGVVVSCTPPVSGVNTVSSIPFGIATGASYDRIENVTVTNCTFGVFLNGNFVNGILNNTLPTPITANELTDAVLSGNGVGASTAACDGCDIEESSFDHNAVALANVEDVEDRFVGNAIDGNENGTGIILISSIKTVVKGNTVVGSDFGLSTLVGAVEFSTIENNHFDGNVTGVLLLDGASGNLLKQNTANSNLDDGFFADATTGANAPGNQLPNRFLSNKAHGNGNLDFEDLTAGYVGPVSGTNDGTANYYKGNKGTNTAPVGLAH